MTPEHMRKAIREAFENNTPLYVQFNGFKVPVIVTDVTQTTVGIFDTRYDAEFTMTGMPVSDDVDRCVEIDATEWGLKL